MRFIILFSVLLIGNCIDSLSQKPSTESWKRVVLCYVEASLTRLYELETVESKTELLTEYIEFIEANDNGQYYRMEQKSIFSEDWFYELGYLRLIPEVNSLDDKSDSFNGFEFLYRIKFMYNSMIEPSEAISEELGILAYRNPNKFMEYLRSVDNSTERRKIASKPWLHSDGLDDFLRAIKDFEYYDEIEDVLGK